MAWYDVPKIKLQYISDEEGKIKGVLLSPADFEKLVERMEDFLDYMAVERAKKESAKFYTHEEIRRIIERKRR